MSEYIAVEAHATYHPTYFVNVTALPKSLSAEKDIGIRIT